MDAVPFRGLTTRASRFADKPEPAEIGGLLWGRITNGANGKTVLIQHAEFVGVEGNLFNTSEAASERLAAALRWTRNDLEPVGYFRSAIRGDLFPREQDRVFVETHLTGPESFMLIIEPLLTGNCTAHFYFLQDGGLQMQSSLLRVPFIPQDVQHESGPADLSALSRAQATPHVLPTEPAVPLPVRKESYRAEGLRTEAMRPPSEVAMHTDEHMALPEEDFPPHSAGWSLGKTLFVAGLLVAMLGVSLYRIVAPKLREPASVAKTSDTPIGLQVERRPDGQLDLTWNRTFARAAGRDGAKLSITDGTYSRTLELTQDQLLSGKLAYFPRSDDIRFHMEMSVDGNRSIGESIRVVSPEVYASDAVPRSRQRTERPTGAPLTPQDEKRVDAILKTDTPGTFILTGRPKQEQNAVSQGSRNEPASETAYRAPMPERIITAAPPSIGASSAKTALNSKLLAGIATPQSLSLSPPSEAEAPVRPPIEGKPDPAVKAPIAQMPKPVYQVMPNTKPFGYSLVNNDMQIDVQVHIDENGVVRQADPVLGRSGKSTMLTAQALIAARKWRFNPAEVNGRKVPSTYVISFKFRRAQ